MAVILTLTMYMVSCTKSSSNGYSACTNVPINNDTAALMAFARINGLAVTQDTSGLYYEIVTQGYGSSSPLLTSTIFVTYTGTLLNGTVIDSTSDATKTGYVLNTLIPAWQIGLQKIRAGGRIKLLCPSDLAYGCLGAGTIVAPNTPLYYDITLVSFQ